MRLPFFRPAFEINRHLFSVFRPKGNYFPNYFVTLHRQINKKLTADEEALIIEAIDTHWEQLNQMIDDVFAGKKIQIKRIK